MTDGRDTAHRGTAVPVTLLARRRHVDFCRTSAALAG
jgi:hypothetical protein